jgi:hypothetical protein
MRNDGTDQDSCGECGQNRKGGSETAYAEPFKQQFHSGLTSYLGWELSNRTFGACACPTFQYTEENEADGERTGKFHFLFSFI